jgi:hypothetical protein
MVADRPRWPVYALGFCALVACGNGTGSNGADSNRDAASPPEMADAHEAGASDTGSPADVEVRDANGGADVEVPDGGDSGASPRDGGVVDAGLSFDASGVDAAALCNPFLSSIPQLHIDYVDASAPPSSTFTGGTIESGTYALSALTEYIGPSGNAATTGETLIIDATAGTMRNAYSDNGGTPVFGGFGFTPGPPGSNWFTFFELCPNSPPETAQEFYTFSGTGPGATLT